MAKNGDFNTGPKLAENSVLLPSECFGAIVKRDTFFEALNREETAAMMPVLSAHDPRIMYVPAAAAYPTKLKKNLFFGTGERMTENVESCKLDSLHVYAVVIAKSSLVDEYAGIYESVYPEFNAKTVYEETMTSVKGCCKSDSFDTTLIESKKLAEENYEKSLEKTCNADELIVIYGTEGHFMELGTTETSISLREYKPPGGEQELIDGVKMIKGLEMKSVGERHEDDHDAFLQEKLGAIDYGLECSNAVLQDLADIMCMTYLPPSFTQSIETKSGAGRKKSCEYYCHVFRKGTNNRLPQLADSNTIKLACQVQKIMEDTCDLSNNDGIEYQPEIFHLMWVNALLGYKSAMRLNCPMIANEDGKNIIIKEHISEASPWDKLTKSSCHSSMTMSVHALTIIVALLKGLKKIVTSCPTCGSYCARNVCSAMVNNQLVSMVGYDESRSDKTGIGYTTVTVRNRECSFIGDVSSQVEDSGDNEKNNYTNKKYYWKTSFKPAAESAAKKWASTSTDVALDRLLKLDEHISNIQDLKYRAPGQINTYVMTEKFVSNKGLGTLWIAVTKSQIKCEEALIQLIMKGNVSSGADPGTVMGGSLGPYIAREHVASLKMPLYSCGRLTKVKIHPGLTTIITSRKFKHMQTFVKQDKPGSGVVDTIVEKCGLPSGGAELEDSIVKSVSEWLGESVDRVTEFLTDNREIYEVVRSIPRAGSNITDVDSFADVYIPHAILYYTGFIQKPYGKNKYGTQSLVRHRTLMSRWIDCNPLARRKTSKNLIFGHNYKIADNELNDSSSALVYTRVTPTKFSSSSAEVYQIKMAKTTSNKEPIMMVNSYQTLPPFTVFGIVLTRNRSETNQFQLGDFLNGWRMIPTERARLCALRDAAINVRKAIVSGIGDEEIGLPETGDIIDSYILNSADEYVKVLTEKSVTMFEHIIDYGKPDTIAEFLIKADELVTGEPGEKRKESEEPATVNPKKQKKENPGKDFE